MKEEQAPNPGSRELEDQLRQYVHEIAQLKSDLRRAEAELDSTNQVRGAILDIIGDLYLMSDEAGKILEFNNYVCHALGYTADDLRQMYLSDLDPQVNSDFIRGLIERQAGPNGAIAYVYPRRKNGGTLMVEARVTTIKLDGELRVVGFGRDIRDRTEAIAAIRDREERFRQLADNVDTVFWLIDWIQQRIVYVNPAYERVFGRPASRLLDDPLDWLLAVHPKDREKTEDAYYPAAVAGIDEQFRVVHSGGSTRWVHGRLFPIHDESGRVYRMAGIIEDITEQKQTEQALLDGERRFRTLASLAPVGIFELDPEGSCLYVNERWCQMTGLKADEVRGSDWSAGIHPEDLQRVTAEWTRALHDDGEYSGEFRFQTPSGEMTWMFAVSLALKGDDGQITGYLGTITDITKLKEAEAALRANELRYRHLYEYSPAMYFTIDADGTVLSVNQFGAQQLGYSVDELVGQPVLSVFHEDDRDEVAEQMAKCASRPDEMFRWEFRKRKKDGTVIWVEEAVRAIDNPDGTRVILVLCEDISARKTL